MWICVCEAGQFYDIHKTVLYTCMVNVWKFWTLYCIHFCQNYIFCVFVSQNIWWNIKQSKTQIRLLLQEESCLELHYLNIVWPEKFVSNSKIIQVCCCCQILKKHSCHVTHICIVNKSLLRIKKQHLNGLKINFPHLKCINWEIKDRKHLGVKSSLHFNDWSGTYWFKKKK